MGGECDTAAMADLSQSMAHRYVGGVVEGLIAHYEAGIVPGPSGTAIFLPSPPRERTCPCGHITGMSRFCTHTAGTAR